MGFTHTMTVHANAPEPLADLGSSRPETRTSVERLPGPTRGEPEDRDHAVAHATG